MNSQSKYDSLASEFDRSFNEAEQPNSTLHPLAKFIAIEETAKPPRWMIPGFIGDGVTVIAGAHGVGKTTALLPLALTVAGLHGDDLMPCQWRHVIYVTEDADQVHRILAGIVRFSELNIRWEQVRERIHIVKAVRLSPADVATVGSTYRKQFARDVGGVEVLPLVVFDTKSAVMALESENDNSEASGMMAALKQGFDGLPVWLIGHVAKATLTRSDVASLSSRGASAIEGDANQTMFLVRDGDIRFLVLGKVRFEPKWQELQITSRTACTMECDEFGNPEEVVMRWGIAAPAQQTRQEASKQAAGLQRKQDEAIRRQEVRDAVETAWQLGNPLNRSGVKAKIGGNSLAVGRIIENLLNEQWLIEVPVPSNLRTISSRAAFFVNLTTEEHEAILSRKSLPDAKLIVPSSWQKKEIPLVPEGEHEP